MKKLILDTNLKYVGEHLSCDNYLPGADTVIDAQRFAEGDSFIKDYLETSTLIFVLEGEISITSAKYVNHTVGKGLMFLAPRGGSLYCKMRAPSRLMRMSLVEGFTLCNKYSVEKLGAYADKLSVSQPYLLPIVPQLMAELEATEAAVSQKLMCRHYQFAKVNIVLILMRGFYEREQLASLFKPVLGENIDFKNLVLGLYPQAKSVKELINLTNTPPTTFNRKFQQAFGMPAGQWIMEKKKESILRDVIMTKLGVVQIARKHGFSSNYLTAFCKERFGLPPMELRRVYNPSAGGD